MARENPLPTLLLSPKRGSAHFHNVEIDGKSRSLATRAQDLIDTVDEQECIDIQTSTFGGYIHSLALSPTSSRIAIAYGNEVALTDVIPTPYRLKEDRKHLPKPPSSSHGPSKSGGPIAKSLWFMRDENHLVTTYTGHGIAYVSAGLTGWYSSSILEFGISARLQLLERSLRGRFLCECLTHTFLLRTVPTIS